MISIQITESSLCDLLEEAPTPSHGKMSLQFIATFFLAICKTIFYIRLWFSQDRVISPTLIQYHLPSAAYSRAIYSILPALHR